ncbi:MAG TPA: LuxR C-terminal-related transcriptional regulator [Ruminiclostridium sp.]
MNTTKVSTITILCAISLLNSQEMNTLGLILKGKSPAEISKLQGVELIAIEAHLRSLLDKFNLTELSDIVHILCELNLSNILSSGAKV